jgi:hypothetical protein
MPLGVLPPNNSSKILPRGMPLKVRSVEPTEPNPSCRKLLKATENRLAVSSDAKNIESCRSDRLYNSNNLDDATRCSWFANGPDYTVPDCSHRTISGPKANLRGAMANNRPKFIGVCSPGAWRWRRWWQECCNDLAVFQVWVSQGRALYIQCRGSTIGPTARAIVDGRLVAIVGVVVGR